MKTAFCFWKFFAISATIILALPNFWMNDQGRKNKKQKKRYLDILAIISITAYWSSCHIQKKQFGNAYTKENDNFKVTPALS